VDRRAMQRGLSGRENFKHIQAVSRLGECMARACKEWALAPHSIFRPFFRLTVEVKFAGGFIDLTGSPECRFDVDFVNLAGVEKALGEAQVDAFAQEEFEQVSIKMAHAHVSGQQGNGFRKRFAELVGAVRGG